MKRFALFVTLLVLLSTMTLSAQTVMVTFYANTATVPDTLGPMSTVQIRGSGGPLTWDGGSPVILENVEGDYWMGSAEFTAGEDIQFKFYTNANDTVFAGAEWENAGWEGNVSTTSGNRELTVPAADTTLDLQFVNGWKEGAGMYETPYTEEDSTYVVWVRVNMQGWEDFNADLHNVGIRGSNMDDWGETGELSWGETYLLSQESNHVNGSSQQYNGENFYSGAVHVPDTYAEAGLSLKVVVHNQDAPLTEDWGEMVYNSQRQDEITTTGTDTTLHWFWFDNLEPIQADHEDEVIVTYTADLSKTITEKGFAFGDTLIVRTGYNGTADDVTEKTMVRQGFSSLYSATDTVTTTIGEPMNYQYYKIKNGTEYREIFYNFYYEGETAGQAERREVMVDGSVLTVEDQQDSESELRRMPRFRNTATISQDVQVTLTCDVRPAIYQVMMGDTLVDIQGNVDITTAQQILDLGVAVNGPMSGNWDSWGASLMAAENHKMWDDGTHGDAVAGDSIYTIQFEFSPDSNDVIGQEFKFGVGGGDNEGGYGNNHIENIDDSQSTFTMNAQFGSIDPVFYAAWDFDTQTPVTGVERLTDELPTEYALEQNYPNPFNPSTRIQYSLVKSQTVKLSVYNVLGREIATLVNEKQKPGVYHVTWDGSDMTGRQVSAGVYFYRIQAGSFVQTHKMMYLK